MLEINGTIIAVIANFIILLWILEHFFYKPVRDGLLERKKNIEGSIAEAQKKLDEAASMKELYEKELSLAQAKAQEIVKNAASEADKMRQEALDSSKKQSDSIIAQARLDAQDLKQDALKSAKNEISGLVILAAGKLIGSKMTSEADKGLMEGFVDKIRKAELN
jgi:F-type H+-transporting ATPase subunit b